MTATICPSCGYDIANDEPATFGGISMAPYGNAHFRGREIRLTRGESAVLWALVKAEGRPLSVHVLQERCGYEGNFNEGYVFLTRIRQKLSPHGPLPIRNMRGVGYYLEEVPT